MNESKEHKGVIYYNIGFGSFVRLAVSLVSCRRVYSGPLTVLCDSISFQDCYKLKELVPNLDVLEIPHTHSPRSVLLGKCRLAEYTPYETSIFIDADTVVLNDFTDLFNWIERYDFAVAEFSNWRTIQRRIARRIKDWAVIYPEKIEAALEDRPAINTGTFGFKKTSELMRDWYGIAEKGRAFFIPDETACQLILPEYKHIIVSSSYNVSCKHDTISDTSKILHFHGRKHCRLDGKTYLYNSNIWYNELKNIKDIEVIKDHINNDRQLRRYYKQWISLL